MANLGYCVLLLALSTAAGAVPAAPPPKLLPGHTRDINGMCHKPGGIYVDCAVAAPAWTVQCGDGTYSSGKIVKKACAAHAGVRRIL